MNEKIEELQDKLFEARSKLSQMRKALDASEKALERMIGATERYFGDQTSLDPEYISPIEQAQSALLLIASIRNEQETK